MTVYNGFARLFVPLAVVAVAMPAAAADTSADLAKLRAHLSSVQSMTASFNQIDSRGRSSNGSMELKKPGRVRFEYAGGKLLLVANGKTLTFVDYTVGQKSSWPLSRTPLGVLLSNSPDLKGKAKVIPSNDPRIMTVQARDPTQYGSLTLVFMRNGSAPGGLQLYGWTAIDAQSKRTTVKLGNVRYNVGVNESAFSYRDPKAVKK